LDLTNTVLFKAAVPLTEKITWRLIYKIRSS
jgi:hypothetical protein